MFILFHIIVDLVVVHVERKPARHVAGRFRTMYLDFLVPPVRPQLGTWLFGDQEVLSASPRNICPSSFVSYILQLNNLSASN